MNLRERVALVTGGSGDLGTAISKALAAAGADIAVAYTGNRDGAAATCGAVQALGRRAREFQLDQTDPAANDRVVDEAAGAGPARHPRQQRGVEHRHPVPAARRSHHRDLGPRPPLPTCAGPSSSRGRRRATCGAGAGRIVNIASVAGLRPRAQHRVRVEKAALIHLTRCLAMALAPDITVNCVAPGLVEGTRMAARIPPEVVDVARRSAVLRRAASGDDIARQVVTFCQGDSVTGQVLNIDGGVHFH